MCGICGVVALDAAETVDPRALDNMCSTLVHRGPDSVGSWLAGPAGLAVRRLAVIDVQGATQPLANEDGHVQVVCNGEIYNYRALRSELRRRGHRFRSNGDCEVIVHAYEEYGDNFLTVLNGMFALALWDCDRQRLVLARDRVGIKPLYYALHNGCVLFGSEPKAIVAYPGFRRALDFQALAEYLTYEYVPTPRSIFFGIHKLRPGHMLLVERNRISEKAHWQLDLRPDPELRATAIPTLAEQLWVKIREAVDLELVSDVPLGVFLSGGIDSSAIAAAAAESQTAPRTFTITFDDPSFDESSYARKVSTYLGTQHEEEVFQPDLVADILPEIVEHVDEPLADPSLLATYLLSRFARQRITVALGGDGGDELFAGYPTLQAHKFAEYYLRIPHHVREHLIAPLIQGLPLSYSNVSLDFRAQRFISGARFAPGERHHVWLGAFTPAELHQLLTCGQGTNPFGALDEHLAHISSYDPLSQMLYLDMKMYLEGDILPKVDRASMACSLEVRVPLLNSIVLDFAAALPIELKLRGLTRKFLLRKALANRLPSAIIGRPKKGFGVPIARWLRRELRPLMQDVLSYPTLRAQGIFNAEYVEQLIADHLRGRRDNRKRLWPLVMFQLWYARYLP